MLLLLGEKGRVVRKDYIVSEKRERERERERERGGAVMGGQYRCRDGSSIAEKEREWGATRGIREREREIAVVVGMISQVCEKAVTRTSLVIRRDDAVMAMAIINTGADIMHQFS